MANTKSAIKNARKTVRLTARNKITKTRLKTLRKRLMTTSSSEGDDAAATQSAASAYASAMDRAVKSGIVHKNAASRAKSSGAKKVAAK